jgi:hypothetical protein
MIKFQAHRGTTKVIGFGLSDMNIQRLREGKPIYIKGEDWDVEFDVTIFWGRTEDDIAAELEKHGMVDKNTVIRKSKRAQQDGTED